ncbi:MAG: carbohydrate kinase [Bacteroidales bacterium]|nr:carbohydrate kinase [Bacteroidales bacterium]
MYLIGYDIGSSSVKASIIEASTGKCISSAFYPKQEMKIKALKPGWAEQDPEDWWSNLKLASLEAIGESGIDSGKITAVGISYQMHGLVLVDKDHNVLRSSIIWCDSRAVHYGDDAFESIGHERCLSGLLNSPGNFTASKLKWVKENEPELYNKVYKIMLPGDYIAMKLTGEINTTISGLSEGILWDFKNNKLSEEIMSHYGFDSGLIPEIVPTFSKQGNITNTAANETGLPEGIPVSYRAGDQPNNAFSLNVLNPGEIAATAGTSGVVYGVSEEVKYDPLSRVNTFAHVNHTPDRNRLGVLLCINGTGILYSWIKNKFSIHGMNYPALNELAAKVSIGSEGLSILPFGNGSERMLGNREVGCRFNNIQFNIHDNAHIVRASQEGIVFSFYYGIQIMKTTGIQPSIIRAGNANMFLSPVFRDTLAGISGAAIELFDTDGSQGAAKGAGIGAGIYASIEEAFRQLKRISIIEPDSSKATQYREAYLNWENQLNSILN